MRWKGGRRSSNIEDRRGRGAAAGGLKLGGGAILLVVIVSLVTGRNPLSLLQMLGGQGQASRVPDAAGPAPPRSAAEQEQAEFVSVILGSTEDVWKAVFSRSGQRYEVPDLVLFDQPVRSACGLNSPATGPFYCPGDRKVYLDLGFFRQLERLGAPGDFARAYVIGHEVGHHVQNITGIEPRVRRLQRGSGDRAQANQLSVLMELQADCLAGVWAHHANQQRRWMEPGDVEEGLTAAESIGDDRLQQRAGQTVRPESFTHGTSAQRAQWLTRGMNSGDIDQCDPFRLAGITL